MPSLHREIYKKVVEDAADLALEPRYASNPRRIDDGVPAHRFQTLKDYFPDVLSIIRYNSC